MLNKNAIILVIIIIGLLTISSVSANEITDDASVLSSFNNNSISEIDDDTNESFQGASYGTFTDLANEIAKADTVLNLNRNYAFSYRDFKYIDGIDINKPITINGNGFVIDGNNVATAFNINASDVILNNVYFIDCYSSSDGGAIYNLGDLSLYDVFFVNNSASDCGGAIFSLEAIYLDSVVFINNGAKFGGAIYAEGFAYVNNSAFINATSSYAPAIFSESCTLYINNTQFSNLRASESAGAVACKEFDYFIVENCDFTNTSSAKNGGAIFLDSYINKKNSGEAYIGNSYFMNTFGDFGGAVLQLNGYLRMIDLTFLNCTSEYDGGAVYLSNVIASIGYSNFISNKVTLYDDYPTFGGAIYFDRGSLALSNSEFMDNSAYINSGAIAIYDSYYSIRDSTFENDGEAIFAVFKDENSEIVNFVGSDSVNDDNVYYPYVISGVGRNLTLIDDEINYDVLPSRFDLRDYNLTSYVMDQGKMGDCWAIAFIATLESSLLKSTGLNATFSVNNLRNSMIGYSKFGSCDYFEGGLNQMGMGYLLSWLGAVPQEYESHDELGKISPMWITEENVHIQDMIILPRDPEIINGDPIIKQAIVKYGGLVGCIAFQAQKYNDFYNDKTDAQYDPEYTISDHQISIVGWDDSFSRKNFLITPPGDGAWICKNTWGTDFGDGGYFYVSYYDKTLCAFKDRIAESAVAILVENTIPYNKNYQYDYAGWTISYLNDCNITYSNRFISIDDDYIAAVGTYFNQSGVKYTVVVKVNGETVFSQDGISPYRGYHTIKLDEYIPIERDDEFMVYITSNLAPCSSDSRAYTMEGASFLLYNGEWIDLYAKSGEVVCLKVYTVDELGPEKQNTSIVTFYDDLNGVLTAVLTNDEGYAIANAEIVINVNGHKYTVKTNSNGQVKFSAVNLDPDTYTVIVSYNGNDNYNPSSATEVILVKISTYLLVEDVSVEYGGDAVLTASLINSATSKSIKNANVIFIINGIGYTVKTDSNGQAKLLISGLAPDTYEATVSYKGNSKYFASSETFHVVVNKITTRISMYYDEAKNELVATLINAETGKRISGANVVFNLNGVKTAVKTNKQGQARFAVSGVDLANFNAGISYGGNSKYLKSTGSIKIISGKIQTVISNTYDKETQVATATLTNNITGQPIKGATVVFNINGVKTPYKTDKLGQVKISVAGLDLGVNSIGSSYGGNSKYAGSTTGINIVKI